MRAIVLIKMNTGDLRAALRDLKRLRSVSEAHLTFGPYDAIAIVHVDDLEVLGRIVAREIQPIPGVVETCTCLMVDSDALENVQAVVYPEAEEQPEAQSATEAQREAVDGPVGHGVHSPFGVN